MVLMVEREEGGKALAPYYDPPSYVGHWSRVKVP